MNGPVFKVLRRMRDTLRVSLKVIFLFFCVFVSKSCKTEPISFAMSVCLSACNNLRTAEQIFINVQLLLSEKSRVECWKIFIKFYTGKFY
jgi:hypothetical protein